MTEEDHAKIVREAQVTQADRQIWFETLTAGCKVPELIEHCRRSCIDRGEADDLPVMEAIVRSRLAAEAAAFEKAAGVPLQISGLIGATSGSSIDSALREASEAIRKLAGEKHD